MEESRSDKYEWNFYVTELESQSSVRKNGEEFYNEADYGVTIAA